MCFKGTLEKYFVMGKNLRALAKLIKMQKLKNRVEALEKELVEVYASNCYEKCKDE